ncbi:MAG: MarR family transcriptional regulator [Chloroflexota bacterium]
MKPAASVKTSYNYSYLSEITGHLIALSFVTATDIAMRHLADLELTTKEFVTLEFIANNPTASQKEIAREIGTKPSLLVKILDDLTRRGLLIRERSQVDRRTQHVRLTKAGELMREAIRVRAIAADEELLDSAGLSDLERAALLSLLQKLTNRVEND